MNNNEAPYVFSTENSKAEAELHTTLLVNHEFENPYFFLGRAAATLAATPAATTVATRVDTGSNTKVVNDWWEIRLQPCRTKLRVLTLIFSLAAIWLIVFGKQQSGIMVGKLQDGRTTFRYAEISCKDTGSVLFFRYVNLTVCAYALLLIALVGNITPTFLRLPAFILNIIAVVLLVVAFGAAFAVEIANYNGTKILVNDSHAWNWRDLCPECRGFVKPHKKMFPTYPSTYDRPWQSVCPGCKFVGWFDFCSILSSEFSAPMGASTLAFICLLAGTCIDAFIVLRRRMRCKCNSS
ncbi:unnamed protein product [Calypogeia fissa]